MIRKRFKKLEKEIEKKLKIKAIKNLSRLYSSLAHPDISGDDIVVD